MKNRGVPVGGLIRVMIVDDSALNRAAFTELIDQDPGLELFAAASDPHDAVEKMAGNMPDVMLLDLELPRMDGLTFLRKIMAQNPIPVIVCSGHVNNAGDIRIRALELGAIEVLGKPDYSSPQNWIRSKASIANALRAAVNSRLGRRQRRGGGMVVANRLTGFDDRPCKPQAQAVNSIHTAPNEKLTADVVLPYQPPRAAQKSQPVIAIGASTGGTEALGRLIGALPADAPAILIVQHMPHEFTGAFAARLNGLSRVTVREAGNGDLLQRGLVLIAPGDHHMMLRCSAQGYWAEVMQGPFVSRHRPSVDVLFRSVAQSAAQNALGIILTGMGDDGVAGLGEMRATGARTLAQDEASSVVYGMPREAMRRGAAMSELPLDRMLEEIIAWDVAAR